MSVRIAVVGSRSGIRRSDVAGVIERISSHYDDVTIVSGGARGVDRWAVEEAHLLGLATHVVPADWATGPLAGKERNWRLVSSEPRLDGLVALWDGWSNGTAHSVTAGVALGLGVGVYCKPPVFVDALNVAALPLSSAPEAAPR